MKLQHTVPCVTCLKCPTATTNAVSLLTARTCDAHLKSYMHLDYAMSALCPARDRGPCIATLSGKVSVMSYLLLFLSMISTKFGAVIACMRYFCTFVNNPPCACTNARYFTCTDVMSKCVMKQTIDNSVLFCSLLA